MTNLTHDPRSKQHIRANLFEYLYDPLDEYFQNILNDIIQRNTHKGRYDHPHFLYKGEIYSLTSRTPLKKNPLLPEFVPEMEVYLTDHEKIHKEEIPLTLGYITTVLNSSNHFNDYFHLLPDVLHGVLKEMVASYPCSTRDLNPTRIDEILTKNQKIYSLIKTRRLLNALLPT